MRRAMLFGVIAFVLTACASTAHRVETTTSAQAIDLSPATLAQVYFWRAKPGKFDEYSRYIRDIAEPIDHEAQRRGAFLAIATYTTQDTASAWTHMRVFLLRDSTQLAGLQAALDSAGMRMEPDSVKRRVRGEYAATLRDRVGAATVRLLR